MCAYVFAKCRGVNVKQPEIAGKLALKVVLEVWVGVTFLGFYLFSSCLMLVEIFERNFPIDLVPSGKILGVHQYIKKPNVFLGYIFPKSLERQDVISPGT